MMASHIDWAKSKAFLCGPFAIRVNLKGRETLGAEDLCQPRDRIPQLGPGHLALHLVLAAEDDGHQLGGRGARKVLDEGCVDDLPELVGEADHLTVADVVKDPGLREQLRARALVVKRLKPLPVEAVVRRSELSGVYVVDGDNVSLRQVRLGRRYGESIEVLAGLDDGG